jgi:F0F1-type ATP synthase assembly protein I
VLALTVALFVALGWWLDQHYGWSPWGVLVLGTLGVAAGMYHFIKDTLR